MTRKIFLSALALVVGLSACGGGDDDSAPAAPATPELRLSITTTEDLAGSYGTVGVYEKISGSISGDVAPPASQVPTIAGGTLVRPEQLVFPQMRGLSWLVAGVATAIPAFDYRAWPQAIRGPRSNRCTATRPAT